MKRQFNFAKGKTFEVKEVIENANESLEWSWPICKCPYCSKEIKIKKNYTIDKIEVLENEDGDIEMLGFTKELIDGKPLTMRLPNEKFCSEKNMTNKIKNKSDFMKEKDNGK